MTLFSPPRRFFVDAAHHASFLAYLDGVDRLRACAACPDAEGKRQFAAHALVSLGNAKHYMRQSECFDERGFWEEPAAGRPLVPTRPEYGFRTMMASIGVCEVRAAEVLRLVAARPVGRDLPFALTLREGVQCQRS